MSETCPCYTGECGYYLNHCPYTGLKYQECPYWCDWQAIQQEEEEKIERFFNGVQDF